MELDADYLVIGAGIAGASIAYELSAHGSVIVLEREEVAGHHSTGRSAATFNWTYGDPKLRALALESRAFFEAPPTAFCEHPLLSPRGVMLIAHREHPELLDASALTRLSADECCARVPVLRKEWLAGGLFDPDSCDVDVNELHQGYLRGAKARGATFFYSAPVTALAPHWRATTPQGEFRARIVINAAGAWGDDVARIAGVAPLGLQAKRRSAFLFDAPSGSHAWPMVIDLGESLYFKPEGQRILASPANQDPVEPHDVQVEELDVALGVDRLQQCTTLTVDRIYRKWAGLRTFAPGGVHIDFADGVRGFFWYVGQGGSGIKIAPAAARQAARLILAGQT